MTTDPALLADAPKPGSEPDRPTKPLPVWQESLILIAVAVLLAVVLKTLFVQAFYIPSESMEPGLVKNDRILVQKASYWFGSPSRGDVIVFEDPGGWLPSEDTAGPTNIVAKAMARVGLYPTGGHLVKRVIGVAGDTVVCCDTSGRITVNGHPLDEGSYARPSNQACGSSAPGQCFGPMPGTAHWSVGPIPEGKMFVMGDNRAHSADSSAHMCARDTGTCTLSPWVDTDLVSGKVMALIWPVGRFTLLHRPDTFDAVPDAN